MSVRLTFRVSVCQGARLFIVAPGAAQEGSGWEGGQEVRVEGDGEVGGGGGGGRGREELQGSSALDRTENKKATTCCATHTIVSYSEFRVGHLCAITVAPAELIVYILLINQQHKDCQGCTLK